MQLWQEGLTDEQAEALIQSIAQRVARYRMETPAVLFLESLKPMGNIGAHAMVACSPFIIPIFGFDKVNDLSRLMSERRHWDRLLEVIEAQAGEKSQELTA